MMAGRDGTTAPVAARGRPAEIEIDAQDAALIGYLESDQLTGERATPVPRAQLSRRRSAALWALRVLGVVLSAMVVYTFAAQLAG
jgi:hypothetical protein